MAAVMAEGEGSVGDVAVSACGSSGLGVGWQTIVDWKRQQ